MKKSRAPKPETTSFLPTGNVCQHYMPIGECPHCIEQPYVPRYQYVVRIWRPHRRPTTVFWGCHAAMVQFFKTDFEALLVGAVAYERAVE